MRQSLLRSQTLTCFVGLLLLSILGGVVLVWLEGETSRPKEAQVEVQSPSEDQPATPGLELLATREAMPPREAGVHQPEPLAVVQEPEQDQSREPRLDDHWVLVVDESGRALGDVELTWSILPGLTSRLAWGPAEMRALVESASVASSDVQGRALFEMLARGAELGRSVIWASKPGYTPAYLGLEPGAKPGGQSLVLNPCKAGLARVLERGLPVRNAEVLQVGVLLAEARTLAAKAAFELRGDQSCVSPEEAVLAFARMVRTDQQGLTSFSIGSFPTLMLASHEGQLSPIALATSKDSSLTFHLGPGAFSASGRVIVQGGGDLGSNARVQCLRNLAGDKRIIGQVSVEPGGTWGPVKLPLATDGNLEFRLLGGGVFSAPIEHDYPAPKERLTVDFDAEVGISQIVKIIDEEGQPVHPARVRIAWHENDAWSFNEAWTDERGLAEVPGCKAPSVMVEATAPGYRTTRRMDMGIPQPGEPEVVMPRAASVLGRVSFEGEPVENFTVDYWDMHFSGFQSLSVRDALDGEFMIDDAPLEQVTLMASSPLHAESERVTVQTGAESDQADSTSPVELKLLPGVQGSGQVVDSVTGEPIQAAIVRILAVSEGVSFGVRSEPLAVDLDGRFQAEQLGQESAQLRVSAEGYVTVDTSGTPSDGAMSFGVIPMARHQDLKIVLEGPQPREVEDWWFAADGPTEIPYIRLPLTGDLDFKGIAPGRYAFCFVPSSGEETIYYSEDLRPGEDWEVHLPWGGGVDLEVNVRAAEGYEVPEDAKVQTDTVDQQGRRSSYSCALPEIHEMIFRSLRAEQVTVSLINSSGEFVGECYIEITGPGPHLVELLARGRDFEVDVVGLSPSELAGAWITVIPVGLGIPERWRRLDSSGKAFFFAPPTDQLRVALYHPELGEQSELFTLGHESSKRIEYRAKPMYPVILEVLDDAQPVTGVLWRGGAPGTIHSLLDGRTNSAGQTGELLLGEGPYTVALSRNGYWPIEETIEVTAPGGQQTLQLRRLGNLRLIVKSDTGVPLAGASVSLTSQEFETSVADWRAAGRLTAEAVQLTTNALGQAGVSGIPHGSYSWTVSLPGGSMSSGPCTVPAGTWGEVTVYMAE